jgi:4-amino-4-deoxy-L-arabinose transferase-like glycosyltransferase
MKNSKGIDQDLGFKSLGIFCLAVAAGLVFTFLVFPRIQEKLSLVIDPDRFGELGVSFYQGEGFQYSNPSSHAIDKGPMYPYFIATVYTIIHSVDIRAVQIAQSILHGLTGVFVFLIGKKFFNHAIALRSQLFCAIHPMLVWFIPRFWIETLFVFLISLMMWAVVSLFERQTVYRSIAAAVIIGIAILTKSVLLFLPAVLFVVMMINGGKASLKYASILVIVSYLCVVPWTIRNYRFSQEVIPVQTTLGMNLIQGDVIGERWHEEKLSSIKLWTEGMARTDSILKGTGHTATDPKGDKIVLNVVVDSYQHHPIDYIKRCGINFLTFWYLGETDLKSIVLLILQIPVLILGIFGLINARREKIPLAPMLSFLIYFVVVYAMIYGIGRFSVPLVPILLLFGVSAAGGKG